MWNTARPGKVLTASGQCPGKVLPVSGQCPGRVLMPADRVRARYSCQRTVSGQATHASNHQTLGNNLNCRQRSSVETTTGNCWQQPAQTAVNHRSTIAQTSLNHRSAICQHLTTNKKPPGRLSAAQGRGNHHIIIRTAGRQADIGHHTHRSESVHSHGDQAALKHHRRPSRPTPGNSRQPRATPGHYRQLPATPGNSRPLPATPGNFRQSGTTSASPGRRRAIAGLSLHGVWAHRPEDSSYHYSRSASHTDLTGGVFTGRPAASSQEDQLCETTPRATPTGNHRRASSEAVGCARRGFPLASSDDARGVFVTPR